MTTSNLINTKFQSLFGWIALEKSTRGITRCALPQPREDICREEIQGWTSEYTVKTALFSEEIKHINDYLEGRNYSLTDISLDIAAAPKFYKNVWEICRSIPIGATRSYKWVAERNGNPKAARAVGQAMANNKITLIIPCHRVVGSDGNLTGFGKGKNRLDLKLDLLKLESDYLLKH
ncbi:methylated-DNA--[protein]-cysteine S-methyltransferase [Chloroflexi bacterium]|nr:methylated-DNA--[protein]-cysteine S-methyltransferase [Chloroflexota bacterium]